MKYIGQIILLLAGVMGASAIALGAYHSHALSPYLSPYHQSIMMTALNYHLAHSIPLALVGILLSLGYRNYLLLISGLLFLAGVVLFSGSLYLMILKTAASSGMAAPIGGSSLILAWLFLGLAGFGFLKTTKPA